MTELAVLNSPYGYMQVGERRYYNGHAVKLPTRYLVHRGLGKLADVDEPHEIPVHWITLQEHED